MTTTMPRTPTVFHPGQSKTTVRVRVLDADDQNPAFYFDKYAAQIPAETGQGVKLQVKVM